MRNKLISSLPRLIANTRVGSSCRGFGSSAQCSKASRPIESSEVEAADPFLSKLQKQTEASYLELLSRKDEVPDTEDDPSVKEQEVGFYIWILVTHTDFSTQLCLVFWSWNECCRAVLSAYSVHDISDSYHNDPLFASDEYLWLGLSHCSAAAEKEESGADPRVKSQQDMVGMWSCCLDNVPLLLQTVWIWRSRLFAKKASSS